MQELSNLVQPRPSPHQQETKQQETSLLSRRTTCNTGRPPGYRSLCCWRLDRSWEWWWDREGAGAWLVLRRAVAGRVSQWRSVTPTTSDGPVNTEDSYNLQHEHSPPHLASPRHPQPHPHYRWVRISIFPLTDGDHINCVQLTATFGNDRNNKLHQKKKRKNHETELKYYETVRDGDL